MSENNGSTIAFKSNLQPIEGVIIEDQHFLSKVRDPFALEILNKQNSYRFTPIQQQELNRASIHCAYAFPDDYPFGTIIDGQGKEKVVCKCINTACGYFKSCRPDFDPSELIVVEENRSFHEKANEIVGALSIKEAIQGDGLAAAFIFGTDDMTLAGEKPKTQINDNNVAVDNIDTPKSIEVKPEIITRNDYDSISDAGFDSFITVEQNDIITADPAERCIINAGPGTGKTWTLIEKIKYMLNELGIEADNILVLCFSKSSVEVVRSRLEASADAGDLDIGWQAVDVRTFDSFATYMVAWVQENIPQLLPEKYILESQTYDERICTATNVFKQEKDMLAAYEHIIVDEVQDLVGVRAEMVLAMLKSLPKTCGFTLLGDSCQALYDYLAVADENVVSSNDFYNSIFHEYKTVNYYSLERNYRQSDEFGKLTIPYRNAIISGIKDNRVRAALELNSVIDCADVNLQHFSMNDAANYTKKGTLGILTRTNGQALQISAWLRTEGVQHILQHPSGSLELSEWIGKVILNASSDVMDRQEFMQLFRKFYYPKTQLDAEMYWEALISTQIGQCKTHYEIEDILHGLIQNARNPLLYENPTKDETLITVSNIHRSKGKEFDTVLVLDDVISELTNEDNEDELEHKVCYVALTRPKKKIEKVHLNPQYIYISKDETRRCYRAGGFGNKKYLSHYEIGDPSDLDARTFALDVETQMYIQTQVKPNMRLKLLKCPENMKHYVVYKLVPEEDDRVALGYTSRKFAYDIERAIQRIYSNYKPIAYKYFPNIFGDIYLDRLTTCVSCIEGKLLGAKEISGMYIWNGISITGFAQMEKDRY